MIKTFKTVNNLSKIIFAGQIFTFKNKGYNCNPVEHYKKKKKKKKKLYTKPFCKYIKFKSNTLHQLI